MKKLLACAALALALGAPLAAPAALAEDAAKPADPGFAYAPDPRYTYKTHRLSRYELDQLFAKPESVLVIDVRRPDEQTSNGSFPIYLSIQVSAVEKSLAWLPKERSIVVVSNRAHRAGAVGDTLAANGFKVAGAIGVLDYAEQGGTIQKLAPPERTASGN